MVLKPFDGPKLKIARGREHAADLQAKISNYLSRDPWAVLLQLNRKTNEHRIALKGREEIPMIFSAIFGDAVHNFRTALDILANDLVALSGSQPKKVYFPFGDSASGFEDQMKEKMKQAPPDIQAIVRTFAPYHGGNEVLRALHALDIGDKHVAIMTAQASAATPPLPMGRRTVGPSPLPGYTRITVEADFGAMKTIPIDLTGFPVDVDAAYVETIGKTIGSEITLMIAKGLPLEGQPVIKTLNDMGNLVERIVQTFEAHCLGTHKPAP